MEVLFSKALHCEYMYRDSSAHCICIDHLVYMYVHMVEFWLLIQH